MMSLTSQDQSLLRAAIDSYHPVNQQTWQAFLSCCQAVNLSKGELLYGLGQTPQSFAFVVEGLLRAYALDSNAKEYNKKFFCAGEFPGSMTALLKNQPSTLGIEAIESSRVITINFKSFRKLMMESEDLKLFQIYYLEKNWLLAKDQREVEIIQEDAGQRYWRFVRDNPELNQRLAQYHIASHLGITPTQLSRIRKAGPEPSIL